MLSAKRKYGEAFMFEPQVRADDSHSNLVRLFRVITIISGMIAVLLLLLTSRVFGGIAAVLTVGLWVTTNGLDGRKPWARWVAYALASAYLLTLSVGGIIFGAAIFVVLWRASKTGAFRQS